MKYLRHRWDEARGDEYAEWGGSWWYFEVGSDGHLVRQIEVYDNGLMLRYGPDHKEDRFGRLGYGHESDMDIQGNQALTAADFEVVWQSAKSSGPDHDPDQAPA